MTCVPDSRPAKALARSSRTWLAAILVLAFGAHIVAFCLYSPGDAFVFVIPWYKQVIAHGMGAPVGNYAPPYIYLLWAMTPLDGVLWDVIIVKLLAVLGALWLCFSATQLMIALKRPWQLGLLALALPSVILNSSMLGQADAFWVAPSMLAVAAALERKPVRVAAWAGLAFAVKQQAAWLAPFVVYYLLLVRAKPAAWLAAPAAFLLAWLPAWLLGWSLYDLLMIYPNQGTYIPRRGPYVENGASLWSAVAGLSTQANFALRWIGLPLAGVATVIYWLRMPRRPDPEQLLAAAMFSTAVIPFFLPMMHERFFMLADVLAFTLAAAFPTKRNILLAILVQIASAWPGYVWALAIEPMHLIAPPIMAIALSAYWSQLSRSTVSIEKRRTVPAEAMF